MTIRLLCVAVNTTSAADSSGSSQDHRAERPDVRAQRPPDGPNDAPDGWNVAEIWERNADRFPGAVAQVCGDRRSTWAEFDRRADGVAATLLAAGVAHQDKVAHYLYNCPEYLESMFGLFKAALVPVNTNYRYSDDELVYLWDNADAVAVIFHGSFTERCAHLRDRVPGVRTWIWVDDGSEPCPDWAIDYEIAATSAIAAGTGRVIPPWGRSSDDLYILYTGGTTGMPKGVMWRQDDMIGSLDAPSKHPLPTVPGWDAFDARMSKPGPRNLPAAPLMHGTGAFNAMWNLALAGSVVTMVGRHFDPIELLDTIQQHQVNSISIVGDAFAKPILRALDAEPTRWDISSLRVIVSSGVMWAAETKAGLLRHNQRLIMIDSLGSSEAIGMASNTTTAETAAAPAKTATFSLGPNTKVLTEDGREVQPGSGERGRVALRGRTPIGYYKDEAKSAATFVMVDGVRWSIPGDWAEVEADGTLQLYGRGSQCINTGGEKVFPEEVEEVLKRHPSVADAAVVGVPDERFGQAITALVEAHAGDTVDEAALIAHVKEQIAHYKAPKRVLPIDTVGRAANGKLDYKRLTADALERLGLA
ncbi:MAG: AMP-binding protein [Actinobacteria bacterium]|nr:AMP-binding protein [Actinomycetota bacterium]